MTLSLLQPNAAALPATATRPSGSSRRVALYSHDTQGLGHIRRNIALAAAMVAADPGTDVLLLTGAPEATSLPLPPNTDVITLPTLRKDRHGRYTGRALSAPLEELLWLRSQILTTTLLAFAPDLFVVDKVARGVDGELDDALNALRGTSTTVVLGLREILDTPEVACREWEAAGTTEAVRDLYDAVWVYGDPEAYDLVSACSLPDEVARKVVHTGYLGRGRGAARPAAGRAGAAGRRTCCARGGGQDGYELADAFVRAPMPGPRGVVLTGPYMRPRPVRDRVARPADVTVVEFVQDAERWSVAAAAVVRWPATTASASCSPAARPPCSCRARAPARSSGCEPSAWRGAVWSTCSTPRSPTRSAWVAGWSAWSAGHRAARGVRWTSTVCAGCRPWSPRCWATPLRGRSARPRPPSTPWSCRMSSPSERRTAYVLKMYPRFSETFIVNELLALEAAGEQIDIFSLRPPNDGRFHESLAEVRAEVTYLRCSGVRAADVWATLGAARAELPGLTGCLDELLDVAVVDALQSVEVAVQLRRRGITHVHAHFGSVATTVARLAARLAEVPYTFTAHAKDIFHEDVDPLDLRRKLAEAAAVVTVSEFNLAHLRASFGSDADRVVRLYNGLDLERFGFADPAARPPVIVAVGRLVEKKGFDDLLEAVGLLVRDGRSVRLELVGTGPCQLALHAQVARLGLHEHVVLHGALPQSRVREVVRSAAAFAAPCVVAADGNRAGLPTVLLEAMALGTPVVGTPVTGIPEVVRHDDTGLLVPERDPQALAAALADLLDDAALRTRLAGRARLLVEAEFDVHRQAGRLRELFAGRPALAGAR